MVMLLHEVWEEPDGQGNWLPGFCLAGPDGEEFRNRLAPGARCVRTFEAYTRASALHQFGYDAARTIQQQDREPYPDEWLERQRVVMNDADLRAYGEIAQALANYAHGMAESDRSTRDAFPDAPGPVYYHYSDSTFEWTAESLWRLKIFRPIGDVDPSGWAYNFVFDCEVKEARDVAIRNWKSGPPLIRLIENFIYLFEDYGGGTGFSAEPDKWFGANSELEPIFESLVAIGYLEESSAGFKWTPLVTRAMYSTGVWDLPD